MALNILKLKEKFMKLCKKYKVDSDLIDFDSIIDRTLNENENLERLYEVVIDMANMTNKIEAEGGDRKAIRNEKELQEIDEVRRIKLEEEEAKKQLNKAVETIISNNLGNLDKYFGMVKEHIKAVLNSDINALFLISKGGFGKSTIVTTTIKECNKDFIYVSSYSTPVEIVNFLYKNKDKNIVFDDFELAFKSDIIINILKSAIWGIGGKRIITYMTTSKRLTAPSQFEFNGKCFFILNEKPRDNALIKALFSRALVYNIDFSYKEIIEILYLITQQEYEGLSKDERIEVFNFIKENSDETCELNLRTLIKGFELYKIAKNNNSINWKEILKNMLNRNEELYLIKKLIGECKTIAEAQKLWCEATGKSRASFFLMKKSLKV